MANIPETTPTMTALAPSEEASFGTSVLIMNCAMVITRLIVKTTTKLRDQMPSRLTRLFLVACVVTVVSLNLALVRASNPVDANAVLGQGRIAGELSR